MEDTNTPTMRQGVNQSDSSTVRNRNLPTQPQPQGGSVTLNAVTTSAYGQSVEKDGVCNWSCSASSPQGRIHHLHKLEK